MMRNFGAFANDILTNKNGMSEMHEMLRGSTIFHIRNRGLSIAKNNVNAINKNMKSNSNQTKMYRKKWIIDNYMDYNKDDEKKTECEKYYDENVVDDFEYDYTYTYSYTYDYKYNTPTDKSYVIENIGSVYDELSNIYKKEVEQDSDEESEYDDDEDNLVKDTNDIIDKDAELFEYDTENYEDIDYVEDIGEIYDDDEYFY